MIAKVDPLPFVKWAGGKRSIINELKSRLPEKIGAYYEPFVGGGALFFELHERFPSAYLSDINKDLISAYLAVKSSPEELITSLKNHADCHSKEYYYSVRSHHNLSNLIEIASRFIYLNRTCYNGLYRVNKKGEFNVPIGSYKNPNIIQEEAIRRCSLALSSTVVTQKQFDEIAPLAGDFVYFDPPYHPVENTSFTRYTSQNFTEKDQINLRDFSLKLHSMGVNVMLSNSNTDFIRDLYRDTPFQIVVINSPRYVSCKASGRKKVEEVLITTY